VERIPEKQISRLLTPIDIASDDTRHRAILMAAMVAVDFFGRELDKVQ
jgi:hypothetical protein